MDTLHPGFFYFLSWLSVLFSLLKTSIQWISVRQAGDNKPGLELQMFFQPPRSFSHLDPLVYIAYLPVIFKISLNVSIVCTHFIPAKFPLYIFMQRLNCVSIQ